MFVSDLDLKFLSTSRDIAAGFWNRDNLENVTHRIFGPWCITGTPWIINEVIIGHFLRLADIWDILRKNTRRYFKYIIINIFVFVSLENLWTICLVKSLYSTPFWNIGCLLQALHKNWRRRKNSVSRKILCLIQVTRKLCNNP